MNCQDIAHLLDEREVEGLLAAEQAGVRAHLATCRDCARDWQIHAQLLEEAIPAVPVELRARFHAQKTRVVGTSARRYSSFMIVGTLVTVAAAALILAWQMNRPTESVAKIVAFGQEPAWQAEPDVKPLNSTDAVLPAEPLLQDESKAMRDWKQRVAEWLVVRDDPDALLAAALLLQSGDSAQRVRLVQRAAEMAPNNPRIQGMALLLCYSPCESMPYEQALQRLAPDNALGWTGEARRAFQADDKQALQRALTTMSKARTFDTYEGASMVAMTSQMLAALVPPPDIKTFVPALAAIEAFSAMPIPDYIPITKTCRSAMDENTQAMCHGIGAAMRAGDAQVTYGLGLNLSGLGLPADSAEARRVAQQNLEFKWISMQVQMANERRDDPEGYLNTFVDHPRLIDAWKAYLEARGIPTKPPAGWKPD